MQVNDDMVQAAWAEFQKAFHEHADTEQGYHEITRRALNAALAHMWRPIGELTAEQNENRILVAGWQKPTSKVAGYWWWHEDVVVDGQPFDHPEAQFWCLAHFALPAPPKTGGE
jgi:hypothetical protein